MRRDGSSNRQPFLVAAQDIIQGHIPLSKENEFCLNKTFGEMNYVYGIVHYDIENGQYHASGNILKDTFTFNHEGVQSNPSIYDRLIECSTLTHTPIDTVESWSLNKLNFVYAIAKRNQLSSKKEELKAIHRIIHMYFGGESNFPDY